MPKGKKVNLKRRIMSNMMDLESKGLVTVNKGDLEVLLDKSTQTDLYIIESLIESIYRLS